MTATATIRFTGKERDAESGLDYFGARYFSGAQGRFTSPDPKQFNSKFISNPQKWNKYAYVLNNPLAAIDPDGREEVKLTVTGFIPDRSFRFPPVIGPTFRGTGGVSIPIPIDSGFEARLRLRRTLGYGPIRSSASRGEPVDRALTYTGSGRYPVRRMSILR